MNPIREKLIYITPEGTVRQKVIIHLTENLQVPIEVVECKAPNIALDLNAKELLGHVLEYIIELFVGKMKLLSRIKKSIWT